ncbi:hypothetical protein GH714_001076 [Hevea brasiliensis]|uniref:Gnk2-homologous domain-containing protein n=1 Tax=Hevea brasiliensis TaxID=3981 RepID=A0A6A6LXA3_HEVBR|nr:hypothetical protein GH714_001076 [Hevea brasiliensis]
MGFKISYQTVLTRKKQFHGGGTDVPPCIIRYANRYIVGRLELDPSNSGYNVDNLPSNIGQFDEIWSSLMERVGTKASMGSSKIKFATGEADYTTLQTIYVMMQCTPDLSQSNCSYCLQQAVGDSLGLLPGKRGGYVLKPSCWFRWDLYPFYESTAADAPQASLPPPPTTTVAKGKRGIQSGTVVITVVPGQLPVACYIHVHPFQEKETKAAEGNTAESLQFDIEAIRVATNNFSGDNKLGEGGFGTVYKGRLPDGPAIAVKRWSRNSTQGEVEFKNEVLLVAMLQHRNLVRLLEYAMHGRFSMKSDVFSFGVLVLEIMSGQKVSCFRNGEVDENLFTYAWRSWNEGTPLNLIDAIPLSVGSRNEMIRCIHVGLLCVQEDVTRRPAMDSVILMLSSHSVSLPHPQDLHILCTVSLTKSHKHHNLIQK